MSIDEMQQHAESTLGAVTMLQTEVLHLCDYLRKAPSEITGATEYAATLHIVIATAHQNARSIQTLLESMSRYALISRASGAE